MKKTGAEEEKEEEEERGATSISVSWLAWNYCELTLTRLQTNYILFSSYFALLSTESPLVSTILTAICLICLYLILSLHIDSQCPRETLGPLQRPQGFKI